MAALLGVASTLAPSGAAAQASGVAAAPASQRPERPRSPSGRLAVFAAAADAPVRVDGVLDEPVWRVAQAVDGFVQAEPREGQPSTERTEVRVAYDRDHLFIGAHLYDSDPDALVVNDIRKDFREGDQDSFAVILDTFADRRNGYVFMTNPEGARGDRQVANEGREINTSWDAVWTVATRRTPDGWTVEMAIPFRALRFHDRPRAGEAGLAEPEGNGEPAPVGPIPGAVWGINFSRHIRRKNELAYWAPVPRSYNLARVSLAGDLLGLPGRSGGRDLRAKPYVAGGAVRETGGESFRRQADVGLDLKYGVTDALTLDVTVNPDFAQVEADVQQVNLTQFSQFFPEKREFFLENSGLFYVGDAARNNRVNLTPTPDEDLLLFFSRRLGLTADGRAIPIHGGVRLTGRAGGAHVGALTMRTGDVEGVPGSDYGVLRVRSNVFSASDVGAVVMARRGVGGGDDFNRVYGVDANFRLPGSVDWSSYVIRTETPGMDDGQYAWRTSVNSEGNFNHVKLGLMVLGDGFNNEMGYYRRTGVRKWFVDWGVRPRPESLRRRGIREMHPHIVWNYYEDLAGHMVAKRLHTGYTFFLNSGAYAELSVNPEFQRIEAPFRIHPGLEPIPAGGYGWAEYQIRGNTDPSRVASLSFTGITGGLWSGRQRTVNATLNLQPSYRIRTSLGVQRTAAELDLPEAEFTRTFWTARSNYSFNTRMFVDALVQYDPGSRLFNSNVRFNLIHRPLSDVFVVYNEQRFMTGDGTPPGRGIILKVTRMAAF